MADFTDFNIVDETELEMSDALVGYKADGSEELAATLTSILAKLTEAVQDDPEAFLEALALNSAAAVTFKNLILSGLSLTGTTQTESLNIAATWDVGSTVETLIKGNVTDTASGAESLLIDLQVAASSKFKVKKDGTTILPAGKGIWLSGNDVHMGVVGVGLSQLRLWANGDVMMYLDGASDNITLFPEQDVILRRGGGAAKLQLGADHATTATDQLIKAHNVTTGAGASLTLSGGTGSTTNGRVILGTGGTFSLGAYSSRIALTYGATLTPNCNDGLNRSVTMTGDCVINAPTNPVDGMVLKLKMLASGGARELTFHSDIKHPTGSSYEATVASGSTRIIELEYNGSAWMLIKNLEFAA